MSNARNPAVILYDAAGNAFAVQSGAAVPVNTPALMVAGKDGAGNAQYLRSGTDGSAYMTPATANGVVDAGNSSTTPLGISGVFTGTATDFTLYADIRVFVFADKAGTLNIQYSSNGTDWDIVDSYSVAASDARMYSVGPRSHYYRVVYTNDGVAQGAFRLQTIAYPTATNTPSIRMSDVITGTAIGLLTKGVITGKTTAGGGAFVDVKVNPSGTLTTDATGSVISPVTSTAGAPVGVIVGEVPVLLAAANVNRKGLLIQNLGDSVVFIGTNSGVTRGGSTMGQRLGVRGTYHDSGFGVYTGNVYAVGTECLLEPNLSVWEMT